MTICSRFAVRRFALAISLGAAACSGAANPPTYVAPAASTAATARSPATAATPTPSVTEPRSRDVPDAMEVPDFAELQPQTYSIRPGNDPASTLRVLFTVPAEGWHRFLGAFKNESGQDTGHRFVAVNFYDVKSVVTEACEDHSGVRPPLGPTVNDLATAAAALEPFEMTSPVTDVEAYGYRGKHLELVVPDIPHSTEDGETAWTECQGGTLETWIAPPLSYAFYGYYEPGQVEALTILDVEGRRLMISAIWHAQSPASDVAEMRSILESIQIQP